LAKCSECGERVVEGATTCAACDAIDGPLVVGRRGGVFVVTRGATLPKQCVSCGAATEFADLVRFQWHSPFLFVGLAGGVIPYLLLVLLYRKQFDLATPFCPSHRTQRTRVRLLGWTLLVGAVAGTAATAINASVTSWPFLAALAAFDVILLIGWVVWSRRASIRPVEITDRYARFAGACPAFLAALE
jgi:hypothetical protein